MSKHIKINGIDIYAGKKMFFAYSDHRYEHISFNVEIVKIGRDYIYYDKEGISHGKPYGRVEIDGLHNCDVTYPIGSLFESREDFIIRKRADKLWLTIRNIFPNKIKPEIIFKIAELLGIEEQQFKKAERNSNSNHEYREQINDRE